MLANGRWHLTQHLNAELDGEDMPNIDALHEKSRLQFVVFYRSLHCARKFPGLHLMHGIPITQIMQIDIARETAISKSCLPLFRKT